ncbi:MAG: hypothetical protein HC861_02220 [Rhodospirillaceae bacterium]|nr:hypothetical protein [Rhodospirillaceae bacterium]
MHHPSSLDRKPDLLARLMAVRKDLPRVRCAIVHPCDPARSRVRTRRRRPA